MERRRYLGSLAVGLGALVAGCSSGEPGSGPIGSPEPTGTREGLDTGPTEGPTPTAAPRTGAIPEAPVAGATTGWEERDDPEIGGNADEPPTVDFDPRNDRLYVRGVVLVGSSSCNEAGVYEMEYDQGDLHVSVTPDRKDSAGEGTPRECTADMSIDDYGIAVTFDEGLPERVVAVEYDAEAEQRRAVYER